TNNPPSDSETLEIRRRVHLGRAHVSELENEIGRLHKSLASLQQECRDVKHHISRYTAVVSPLRRFPPEILTEIFHWTLSIKGDAGTLPSWNLSHVCGRWRVICLSSPRLWSI
ncbi:hypothetical protein B0H16DRAFT_1247879, partial [Mycena metata]